MWREGGEVARTGKVRGSEGISASRLIPRKQDGRSLGFPSPGEVQCLAEPPQHAWPWAFDPRLVVSSQQACNVGTLFVPI